MISLRLLNKHPYRCCSSFSSVLTFGKQYRSPHDKPQSAENDCHLRAPCSKTAAEQVDGLNPGQRAAGRDHWGEEGTAPVSAQRYADEDSYAGNSGAVQRYGSKHRDPVGKDNFKSFDKRIPRDYIHYKKESEVDNLNGRWDKYIVDAPERQSPRRQKPGKHNRNRRDERNVNEWDPCNANRGESYYKLATESGQWDDFSAPHGKSSEHQRGWNRNSTLQEQRKWLETSERPRDSPRQQRSPQDATPYSSSAWNRDKPRGKRLRKKDKLGFIESESAPDTPAAEHLLYGLHPVSLALSAGRRRVLRVYHRAEPGGRLAPLLAECAARGIGATPLPAAQLDRIAAGTGVHQGVCARVTPLPTPPVDELLTQVGCPPLTCADRQTEAVDADDGACTGTRTDVGVEPVARANVKLKPEMRKDVSHSEDVIGREDDLGRRRRRVLLFLDRVQDPMNFGSIIRSSYFLGVDAIIIPDKNSCPLSPTVSKASAGTMEVFPIYSVPSTSCRQLLQLLGGRGWQLLAAETTAGEATTTQVDICPSSDTLLVVGNEGRGVDPALASLCGCWTVPPQRHLADGVESLNVGVATGILLSQLTMR